jgi:hypothetical protein
VIGDLRPGAARQRGTLALDLAGIAEAIEHHVRAGVRQRFRDPLADPAGGTGDDRTLSFEHAGLSMMPI